MYCEKITEIPKFGLAPETMEILSALKPLEKKISIKLKWVTQDFKSLRVLVFRFLSSACGNEFKKYRRNNNF